MEKFESRDKRMERSSITTVLTDFKKNIVF